MTMPEMKALRRVTKRRRRGPPTLGRRFSADRLFSRGDSDEPLFSSAGIAHGRWCGYQRIHNVEGEPRKADAGGQTSDAISPRPAACNIQYLTSDLCIVCKLKAGEFQG